MGWPVNTNLMRILAVDDEQLLLWALERACKGRFLDIRTAVTTEQAIEQVAGCDFDLFLLDFDLKDPSRLELLKAIDKCCPYVPIIIMTTSDTKSSELNDIIRATRKHGAWHLLEKPFSLDRMIGFIEVIFQDQGNVKVCLNSMMHNYDHEKRHTFRRPHVQPVNFSYETIANGVSTRVSSRGILTDISHGGSGMLAHEPLQPDQVISFDGETLERCGAVSWSVMIADNTYRCGLQFC